MSDANPPYTKLPDIDLLVRRIMEAVNKAQDNSVARGLRLLRERMASTRVVVSWSIREAPSSAGSPEPKAHWFTGSHALTLIRNEIVQGAWRALPGRPGYVVGGDGAAFKADGDTLALLHLLAGLERKAVNGVLAVPGFNHGAVLDEFPLIKDRLGERFLLILRVADEALTMAALEAAVLGKESSNPSKPTTGRRRI